MSRQQAKDLGRKIRRYVMAFGLLFVMCLSYEARGDDDDYEATPEDELAPGIKLRIESCGYDKPRTVSIGLDDDDAADDDDSATDPAACDCTSSISGAAPLTLLLLLPLAALRRRDPGPLRR